MRDSRFVTTKRVPPRMQDVSGLPSSSVDVVCRLFVEFLLLLFVDCRGTAIARRFWQPVQPRRRRRRGALRSRERRDEGQRATSNVRSTPR
jgi:hypothetical protein